MNITRICPFFNERCMKYKASRPSFLSDCKLWNEEEGLVDGNNNEFSTGSIKLTVINCVH